MFDIAPTELMLVAVVALVVIGPKDLPKAMRFVGHWVAKGRAVMGQFRSGFDTMVREAELQEMEKKWAAENERIMREHAAPFRSAPHATTSSDDHAADDAPPVMVSQPVMIEHPAVVAAAELEFALEPDTVPPAPKATKPRKSRAKAADTNSTDPKAAS
ncbi:twin-arginine translocase subunit TatB [Sphingomonas aliaeris]|uniref:Twin-arginine translocase subunit TatB n=1 Tax=Sphingomonas aliaeris TaxID=2759526 RepID=A0A974NWK5_9SPHN|nr:Sec-independent protein translocase protein TatB [Sphingomonas aliaeris]QQV78359.1 twin-arginine translocase subunit TatB [Sphingomonas aliaeris]